MTYDSKESKAVLGLIFLAFGVLTILSIFLDGQVFQFFKSILYNDVDTFILGLFFMFCSLNAFNSKFILTKKRSLLGQLMIVIGLAGFFSSVYGSLPTNNGIVSQGGFVGNYLYNFLSQNLFFNFTPIVFMVILIFAIPFTLVMPISRFLDILGVALQKTVMFVWKVILKKKSREDKEQNRQVDIQSAATFGDFQKNQKSGFKQQIQAGSMQQKDGRQSGNTNQPIEGEEKNTQTTVKEVAVDGAFINSELQFPDWKFPPLSLLNPYKKVKPPQDKINRNADIIEKTLTSFGIKASVVDVIIGPSVSQYALDVALGVKVNKIANLIRDLALALATQESQVRLLFPIPNTSYVGIEIPNPERETVYLKEILSQSDLKNPKIILPLAFGKDIAGKYIFNDLQRMPHVLVAGATGSGKSILINGFILSLLYTKTPDEVKFIMVDPKQVELAEYNGIPYLLTPVITEMDKVLNSLKWAIAEMEQRYTIFRESHVKNIESYNQMKGYAALPYIIIVIDEMADMMMSTNKAETETAIVRLAQKARATGIHLILATQRPSVNVLTGLIKANIPGRIGMSVTTRIDSQVILDQIGAESLLGKGDMLFKDPAVKDFSRIQAMWVAPDEILRVVEYIKLKVPEVSYAPEITEARPDDKAKIAKGMMNGGIEDNQFANAVRVVVNAQKGSTSLIQRKLSLGYNRAARLLDKMEELGVVGTENGSKPRDVFIADSEEFLKKLSEGAIGSVTQD